MVDSTIQENCVILPGTFKNSAAVGSVFNYWPLQVQCPIQLDEIVLGTNVWRLPSRRGNSWPLFMHMHKPGPKRQKVFGKTIRNRVKISELLASDILRLAIRHIE
jgi:hypothetical protein